MALLNRIFYFIQLVVHATEYVRFRTNLCLLYFILSAFIQIHSPFQLNNVFLEVHR